MRHEKFVLGENDIFHDGVMFLMTCPICGMIHASGSDKEVMPEMGICTGFDEDVNGEVSKENDKV